MADGSVEFFVALLGEMKIKAANAAEYAERLVAEDYDRELFVEMSPDELKADIGFSSPGRLPRQRRPRVFENGLVVDEMRFWPISEKRIQEWRSIATTTAALTTRLAPR